MKGTWVAGPFTATAGGQPVFTSVSFNIPSSSEAGYFYMKEGETQSPLFEFPPEFGIPPYRQCDGGVNNPTVDAPANIATSGATGVCLFTAKAVNWDLPRTGFDFGVTAKIASPSAPFKMGAVLQGESEGPGVSYAYGTWAVKTVP